ncbi:glycine receptor subunit alphaZ1-like, partial [Centruroides sculpturatus]|uniref:glycine receptor subunit alphaZ1-like n=1 Tax=Centruroides sculpturatus TaxID=218467 RepID=UPI000C6DDF86
VPVFTDGPSQGPTLPPASTQLAIPTTVGEGNQKYWLNMIPTEYDKYAPPIVNGKPVIVYVNLEIMDVDDIREDTMDFRVHLYQNQIWRDPRIKLHTLNITKVKVLPPSAEKDIWIPDLIFDNSKWGDLFQYSIPNTALKVNTDHTLQKVTRYSFRVACHMKFQTYPIDIQHCIFKIGYLTNSEDKAILQWSGATDSPYRNNRPSITLTEDIQPLKYEMRIQKPFRVTECWINGNFSYLLARFTFIRRLTGCIINLYVPSTLVVCLSWLSFWLNVNAVPARITLGTTSILTLITQIVQSRSHTPPVNYINALDIWLFACTAFVTASILEYALAHQFMEHKNALHPSMQSTGKWAENCPNVVNKTIRSRGKKTSIQEILKSGESISKLDYYSRFIFPCLFFIFAICYWWYFLQRRKQAENQY